MKTSRNQRSTKSVQTSPLKRHNSARFNNSPARSPLSSLLTPQTRTFSSSSPRFSRSVNVSNSSPSSSYFKFKPSEVQMKSSLLPSTMSIPSFSSLTSSVTNFFGMGASTSFRSSLSTMKPVGREPKTRGASKKTLSEAGPKREKTQDEIDLRKLQRLEREKKKEETRRAQLDKSNLRKQREQELRQQKVERVQQETLASKIIDTGLDDKEKLEFERYQQEYLRDQELAQAQRRQRRRQAQQPQTDGQQ